MIGLGEASPPSLPRGVSPDTIRGFEGGEAVDRVLIADDHPLVRDGLRAVISLAFEGCELFEAATLDEALGVLGEGAEFDLVLLDLTCRRHRLRRARPDGRAISRRRLSSWCPDRIPQRWCAARSRMGRAGFVPKSLRRSAIAEALRAVLDGEIYVPPTSPRRSRPRRGGGEDPPAHRSAYAAAARRLRLDGAGRLNKQIAYELDVSMTTVKAHVSAVLAKLEVFNRTQAVILANRVGFRR